MPIYEFTCTECGAEFETRVPHVGDSAACPSCQSTKVRRRLSGFASGPKGKSSGRGGSGFS